MRVSLVLAAGAVVLSACGDEEATTTPPPPTTVPAAVETTTADADSMGETAYELTVTNTSDQDLAGVVLIALGPEGEPVDPMATPEGPLADFVASGDIDAYVAALQEMGTEMGYGEIVGTGPIAAGGGEAITIHGGEMYPRVAAIGVAPDSGTLAAVPGVGFTDVADNAVSVPGYASGEMNADEVFQLSASMMEG